MVEELRTGQDIIRDAMFARSRRGNISFMAREINSSTEAVEAFIAGRGNLSAEVLNAVAHMHWGGGARYVADKNALQKTN